MVIISMCYQIQINTVYVQRVDFPECHHRLPYVSHFLLLVRQKGMVGPARQNMTYCIVWIVYKCYIQ